jgi:hypothetical protein
MNLEDRINKSVSDYLESDVIEEKVSQSMDKAIDSALSELFSGYRAPVKEVIEEKLKEQFVPAIEKHDFSRYIVKLDDILSKILQESTFENKKILENFKEFAVFEKPKEVKLSELFEKYLIYVSKNIDTSKLEVEFEDEPYYESPECELEFEEDYDRWSLESSFSYATIRLSCEKDEDMHLKVSLSRWKDEPWKIRNRSLDGIDTLRTLNDFEVFLINLSTFSIPIVVDEEYFSDYPDIEEKPEASFY